MSRWILQVLTLITCSNVAMANSRDIEVNLQLLQSTVIKIMKRSSAEALRSVLQNQDPAYATFLYSRWMSEFEKLNVNVLRLGSAAFTHYNQQTYIETDLKPYGQIRVVPDFFKATLSLKNMLKYINHEIAHHILQSNSVSIEGEKEAWDMAEIISQWVEQQLPHPQLLNLRLGAVNATSRGCRDTLDIQSIDFFNGRVIFNLTSQGSHCPTRSDWNKRESDFLWKFKKNNDVHDTVQMTMKCSLEKEDYVCRAQNFYNAFSVCTALLRYHPEILNDFTSSENTLTIAGSGQLQMRTAWCISLRGGRGESQLQSFEYTVQEQLFDLALIEPRQLQERELQPVNVMSGRSTVGNFLYILNELKLNEEKIIEK